LEQVRSALPAGQSAFLVGGAIRDALLSRPTHDLDFVLPGSKVLKTSRVIADKLGGAYYPLDEKRGTARIILKQSSGSRQILDFASLRSDTIEGDLRLRDFTINAIALDIKDPQSLIDPLEGARDLHAGLLRSCSEKSMLDDPVRALRGVRLSVDFGLKITTDTNQLIRQAVPLLPNISAERSRDELFRILSGQKPWTAIQILEIIGALPFLLPELVQLIGVKQTSPHIYDVWTHTLNVVENLTTILNTLSQNFDPDKSGNWALAILSLRLGRYREQLHDHLQTFLNPNRSLRGLLVLAALYHDSGKPLTTQTVEGAGELASGGPEQSRDGDRIRFIGHERQSAHLVSNRATQLRLNNNEIGRLKTIIRNHMRPLWLAQEDKKPSRRAVYRFFRDCGEAGVDICLLSLADTLGAYGPTLPEDIWVKNLDVVRALLESYWEQSREKILPKPLLNGNELISTYSLEPGPVIGQLIEAIREAQVVEEITSRDQALLFAKNWLKKEG